MKTFFLSCLIFTMTIPALASDSVQYAMEDAIGAFNVIQTPSVRPGETPTPTRMDVLAQVSDLLRKGYLNKGETTAVTVSGSCGFAGCGYTFLVSTPYSQRSVNPQTRVVSGLVTVDVRGARVLRTIALGRLGTP